MGIVEWFLVVSNIISWILLGVSMYFNAKLASDIAKLNYELSYYDSGRR